jgi:alkaline phosphatase D
MSLDLANLRAAVRYEGGVSRRLFLAYGAALSALPVVGARAMGRVVQDAHPQSNPFALGVASGEPSHRGFVLWTRLAPKPLEGGGMPNENVEVRWEVASDDAMKQVVRSGTAIATPQLAHSVHVLVDALEPDRWYWYRFRSGDAETVIGRARTSPAPDALPAQLRFAFASCQHFEQGLYTSYEHMAREELDLVVHLGDYIYDGPGRDKLPRKHLGGKVLSLADYRTRHSQYRTDPLLQAMHARCPWIVTWDDHDVEDDYAGPTSERKGVDAATFLEQRANAYQAYYEMLPLRPASVPHGPDLKLYRTISYGRLATFQVLDTRQYRSPLANGGRNADLTGEVIDPKRTIMGAQQAGWIKAALLRSTATWNVLAQQVLMAMVDATRGEGHSYSMDKWTGYAHDRIKLMEFIAERKVINPIVLTGDIHSNWVTELRVDDRKADQPLVAAEFVGTSLSSGGNGTKVVRDLDAIMAENPCVKYHDRLRGYATCTVTPKLWRTDYRGIENVTKPGGEITSNQAFVVETGRPNVTKA